MTPRGVLAALLLAAASTNAGAALPDSNLTCRLRHPAVYVDSLKKLPAAIQAQLQHMAGAMADRGQPFNAGDVLRRRAPFNRFIRGGKSGGRWFVWYEHGGFAYWHAIAILAANPAPGGVTNARATGPDLCALTDKMLDSGQR